jgi:hypothetical protein
VRSYTSIEWEGSVLHDLYGASAKNLLLLHVIVQSAITVDPIVLVDLISPWIHY